MTNLTECIAPAFYPVHNAIKRENITHYWLKGGRGSTKSSFAAVEIILGMMQHPDANAVCLRKVGLYLKDSVYEQLVWAISKLGVSHLWEQRISPMMLIYLPTGQRILFRGADKPKKIKSTKVSKGYIRYIWYEECDEFLGKGEIDTINQSLMRGGDKFDIFYSYNPPKSQTNWLNREIELQQTRPDTLVHHSDYRSVPESWLGEPFLQEAEQLQATNEIRYLHEYLGEVTGTGGEVFRNVTLREITKSERESFDRIRRGLDWGYGPDPFVYLALHYDRKRRKIFIFHEFYKHRAGFDEIASEIHQENPSRKEVIAESAEPRSNDELKARGVRLTAAKKGPGSVEHGVCWLQDLNEIIIDPVSCPNAAREFTGYELERTADGSTFKSGFPDKDNHTIDAVRYACERDMQKGGYIAQLPNASDKLGAHQSYWRR